MKDRSYVESFYLFILDVICLHHGMIIMLFTSVFSSEETSVVTLQPVNNKCDVEALFVKTSANDSPVRAVIQFDMSLIVLF